jgi:NADH-quinone oxidoreductase subunit J
MTELQIFFIVLAAITLGAALMVVTVKNLVHAAFYLILTLLGIAVTFILLNATYLAVIQVLVYIGAIAILIIMAVMVTRNVTGQNISFLKDLNGGWMIALLVAAVVCATLILGLIDWSQLSTTAPDADTSTQVVMIGTELVGTYVVPTILAGMLLLAAMVGAIMVAWPKKMED